MFMYHILRSPDSDEERGAAGAQERPSSQREPELHLAKADTSDTEALARGKRDPSSAAPDSGVAKRLDTAAESGDKLPVKQSELEALIKAREALYTRELAVRDQKATELERAYRAALRDRELATALAGKALLPGAAAQLVKLWRDDLDVHEIDGEYTVTARDGRSVGPTVNDWLACTEYAHFCLPSSRGGTASKGSSRSPATDAGAAPKNLGEATVLRWKEGMSRRNNESSTPIGLGRRR
jgi:hypothetical protein